MGIDWCYCFALQQYFIQMHEEALHAKGLEEPMEFTGVEY